MENASKALIMAGSILIALMVIGLLNFTFSQISDTEQTIVDAETIEQTSKYINNFEQIANKKYVYGSEILSAGNLKNDYENHIDAGVDIDIKVIVHTSILKPDGSEYITKDTKYDISKIMEKIRKRK